MNLDKIGKFISFLRKEKKLTQIQLAEKLNVSDKTVSKWERGICLPEPATIELLINFFNITLIEFYDGERKQETRKKNRISKLTIKKSNVITSFLLITLLTLCILYKLNNRYITYNISTTSNEYTGQGNIIISKEKNLITLFNLSLIDENTIQIKVHAYQYTITIDDILILHEGDIFTYENNSYSTTLGNIVKNISINIEQDINEILKKGKLKEKKLYIDIKYLDEEYKEKSYVIKFDISKEE